MPHSLPQSDGNQTEPFEALFEWRYQLKRHVYDDLENLKGFSEEAEGFLASRFADAKAAHGAINPPDGTFQGGGLFSAIGLSSSASKYLVDFPDVLRQAVFVHAFSRWEHSLEAVCSGVEKNLKLNLSLKHMKGDVLERAKLYLKRLANIPFPENRNEDLRALGNIRNLFVHSGGMVPKEYETGKLAALRKFFGQADCGEISQFGRIHLGRRFLPTAIDVFDAFWKELFLSLEGVHGTSNGI